MNHQFPIYTTSTQCHDCYKCVRQCPVKAIKIESGKAEVLPELCIACGHCVVVCPSNAKHIRNDINRAKFLIKSKSKVIASIAPSYTGEFLDLRSQDIIEALKKLGFYGVSEVAIGAEKLSEILAEEFNESNEPKTIISSACPAAVEHIARYHKDLVPYLSMKMSPAQIHASMLKEKYGKETAVIFIGPCSAKKIEADQSPDVTDLALTFTELREWLDSEGVYIEKTSANHEFLMGNAGKAKLYPIETGMIKTIEDKVKNLASLTLAGIPETKRALKQYDFKRIRSNHLFIELLACKGGCINGPCIGQNTSPIDIELSVLDNLAQTVKHQYNEPIRNIIYERKLISLPVKKREHSQDEIQKVLYQIGKRSKEQELNCSGCGYQNCRNFAAAVLEGKAEPAMCLSYLKERAQQKANAIMHYIPAGLVLVDPNIRIIECNTPFTEIFKDELKMVMEVRPDLHGMSLSKIIPIEDKFREQLNSKEVMSTTINYENKIIDVHIFPVNPGEIIGGFFQDITNSEMRHEEIATLAKTVIDKNLGAVQEIACRLGENMAETEILLRTLIKGFSSEKIKKLKEEKDTTESK